LAEIPLRASHHTREINSGRRFAFGRNWARFLKRVNDQRIALAVKSLQDFLELSSLDGLSFLDVGSGSGLFSLAARRLGARVHSFDYDPQSVACTIEMRRRFAPGDSQWTIEQGSILDPVYLHRLGAHDIVYSWGVLHHTGQMHQALENVKSLVPIGGRLFISIYNDQGPITDRWAAVKRRYNSLPRPLSFLYALGIIGREEWKTAASCYRETSLRDWLKTWTDYGALSARGMSRWHDWIDWIGGYPYERATCEDIVDVFAADGFRLVKLGDRSNGYGCNEFVFRRDYSAGIAVDVQVAGARSMARRIGLPLCALSREMPSVFRGRFDALMRGNESQTLFIIEDDRLIYEIHPEELNETALPAELLRNDGRRLYVVAATSRTLEPPFHHFGGHAWGRPVPELEAIADPGENGAPRSPAFVFEDRVQLPIPHALHDDIRVNGQGRFSHWNDHILFSTLDNSDPNTNGRRYELVIPAPLPSADRSD
jgi:2-polyprenyl-3-methyl-5-hydroxy-6-metoxy-1,4-benzoquinol methylase